MTKTPLPLSAHTRLISAGINQDKAHGAIMPPIYLSTNFSFEGLGKKRTFDYARSGQPNRETLADLIAELEGGAGAVISSSGLAALDLLWQDLGKGARVVVPHDCYGGTQRLLNARNKQGLIECV
jgi:cystathionine gamma-synthase